MTEFDFIKQIKTIIPVDGDWYRIKGTKENPVFEKILCWAVVQFGVRDNDSAEDIIVGIAPDFIGVIGNQPDDLLVGVAGYIKANREAVLAARHDPKLLDKYELSW